MSILIPKESKFNEIKENLAADGKNKIHVLLDFDRTLTYATNKEGKKVDSIISILRNYDYLTEDYPAKAKKLFEIYHPIEIDTNMPEKEKKEKMREWWQEHFELLIKSGLNKKDIQNVVDRDIIKLREGVKDFFKMLEENNIPSIIISSSGIGDSIKLFFDKNNIPTENISIITNCFEYNEEGFATKRKSETIHALNKDETTVSSFPEIMNKIDNRKNVILIGDGLGDLDMVKGFEYKNLLKIGFLNPGEEQNEETYKEKFDVILKEDPGFKEINDLLGEIIK